MCKKILNQNTRYSKNPQLSDSKHNNFCKYTCIYLQKLTNHCARRASAWQARASESVANAVGDVAEFSLGLKLQCIPSASANFVQKCTATPSTTTDLPPADGPTAQTSAHLHACALQLQIALFSTLAALLCLWLLLTLPKSRSFSVFSHFRREQRQNSHTYVYALD